jgi:hypothetical protein
MTPDPFQQLNRLIYTLENDIFPVVAESGRNEVLRQAIAGTALLRLIDASWDNEGETVYNENKELRRGLKDSVPALKRAGHADVAHDLETLLAGEYYPQDGYPILKALRKENNDLKDALEKVLVSIASVKEHDPSLDDVRANLYKIIKDHLRRDIELQEVVQGFYFKQRERFASGGKK